MKLVFQWEFFRHNACIAEVRTRSIFTYLCTVSCIQLLPGTSWNLELVFVCVLPNSQWLLVLLSYLRSPDNSSMVAETSSQSYVLLKQSMNSSHAMVLFEGAPSKRSVLFMNYDILKSERWQKQVPNPMYY